MYVVRTEDFGLSRRQETWSSRTSLHVVSGGGFNQQQQLEVCLSKDAALFSLGGKSPLYQELPARLGEMPVSWCFNS